MSMPPQETPEERKEAIRETADFIMYHLKNFETNKDAQKVMADLGAFYRGIYPDSTMDFGKRLLSLRALCQPLCENPEGLADSGEKIFRQALALAEAWGKLTSFNPAYTLKAETRREIAAFRVVPSPKNMVNMVYSIGQDLRPEHRSDPDPLKDIVLCLARLCKRWVLMTEESKGRSDLL